MIEKKFKNTESGIIPEDWGSSRIDSIGYLKAGSSTTFDKNESKKYPCYGGNGIRDFVSYYSYDGVFPIIGRQGALCGNLKLAIGKFHATEHAVVVTVKKGVNPYWAYYALDYANLNQYASGCAQPGLAVTDINSKEIACPPIDTKEQEKIASALSDIDSLISTLEKLIVKKRNIKQGAMQELLSGKIRLAGFTGKWINPRLNEIATFAKGTGLSKNKLSPFGKYKCVLYGEIFTTYNYAIDSCKSSTNYIEGTKSCFNDVLMPSSTTTNGRDLSKAVAIYEQDFLLGGDIIIIRDTYKRYDGYFLASYISELMKDKIEEVAHGTTIYHLRVKDIQNLSLKIPKDVNEQKAIANVLKDMDSEISSLESRLSKYRDIKQGMMQQLLTGKIRLI